MLQTDPNHIILESDRIFEREILLFFKEGYNMKPLSFIIVGSGWRSLYTARIAKRFPELFELKYLLCRSQEKAQRIAEEHHIPTTTSVWDCEQAKPDFVVIAVNFDSNFEVIREWVSKGYAVFAETPAASSVQDLKELWDLKERCGARVQIAEQYHRYPIIAAGLQALKEGLIGDPYSVRLSVAHDYHGASLIRRMLCSGFEPMTLHGNQYTFPVTETDSRYGPITDGSLRDWTRDCVTIDFGSGKTAYYDFSSVQYRTFIRARHLNVQGIKGEWNDTILRYVGADNKPVWQEVKPVLNPRYQCLETEEVRKICSKWNPFLTLETEQDYYALSTMMYDLRDYLEGGPEVYPLSEALEDAYMLLLIKEAATHPWQEIRSEPMPWHCA